MENFENPKLEIIELESSEVICTSGMSGRSTENLEEGSTSTWSF